MRCRRSVRPIPFLVILARSMAGATLMAAAALGIAAAIAASVVMLAPKPPGGAA